MGKLGGDEMREIAISGLGLISSIGTDLNSSWNNILEGASGADKVKKFSETPFHNYNACEIKKLTSIVSKNSYMGSATSLFFETVKQALEDASLSINNTMSVGISIGTTMGEIDSLENHLLNNSKWKGKAGPNVIADQIYEKLNLQGPKWTITNACAAGNIAISRAMEDIIKGNADVMIAGGVDILSWVALSGFNSLKALSPDQCRPFDKNRRGLLLGEGSGVVILESKEHLRKRAKKRKALLVGYGLSSDAHHITQPDPEGDGASLAMKKAIEMGNISKEDIGYISAHGTGTVANDLMENVAIKKVFGTNNPLVSSIKGHIGHTLGAASAIEAIISVKILNTGMIPHTLNLKKVDPNINLNLVKGAPFKKSIDYVLSNSYAFGGVNSSLLIRR
ncbi:beta-ketoacyl-[acyl-carrier-protein] synthase family protein [Virgibacillus dokdonensis]|uniref:beta-ketoacyl-[acyl-carrier-protein] synthase family protein n=1 Tax=Virgibacillus dokdonensis TaxID=302167 RepID=UPI00098A535A|nr:beta-ketoacyl-[acyl-carrier-protein] synthase family protein [Virgibacillus dokdonensis]